MFNIIGLILSVSFAQNTILKNVKIVNTSANHVLINSGSSVIASEAQLSTGRGGTGANLSSSSGVLKAVTGTISASTITNSDIASNASINRSKIELGTSAHVLINDGTGALSSEAQLSILRGGTGRSTALGAFNALSPMTSTGDLIYGGTNGSATRLGIGSAGQILTVSGGSPAWAAASPGTYITIADVKASTALGGTAVTATWTARNLNTLNQTASVVVNGSSFTGTGGTNTDIVLPAGTYYIKASAPFYGANRKAKIRIRNTTDSSTIVNGQTMYQNNGAVVIHAEAIFTLASQKTIQLQYYYDSGLSTDDLGPNLNSGDDMVFSQVLLIKF
jgi:hypothetical protein